MNNFIYKIKGNEFSIYITQIKNGIFFNLNKAIELANTNWKRYLLKKALDENIKKLKEEPIQYLKW
ncbi:MAG: hypothetical protein QXD48_00405 [Candidatus Aenigmatarchaeota archaeon]